MSEFDQSTTRFKILPSSRLCAVAHGHTQIRKRLLTRARYVPSGTLLRRPTAVGGEGLTGHERSVVRAQPQYGFGNFFGTASTTNRVHVLELSLHLASGASGETIEHRRLDATGGNGIDTNSLAGVLKRRRFREPEDGMLAGHINRRPGKANQPADRRIIDDGPSAVFQHRRNFMFQR